MLCFSLAAQLTQWWATALAVQHRVGESSEMTAYFAHRDLPPPVPLDQPWAHSLSLQDRVKAYELNLGWLISVLCVTSPCAPCRLEQCPHTASSPLPLEDAHHHTVCQPEAGAPLNSGCSPPACPWAPVTRGATSLHMPGRGFAMKAPRQKAK